jgi:hypothetical protein
VDANRDRFYNEDYCRSETGIFFIQGGGRSDYRRAALASNTNSLSVLQGKISELQRTIDQDPTGEIDRLKQEGLGLGGSDRGCR